MRVKFAMLLNPEVALRFTVAKQNAMIVVCTWALQRKRVVPPLAKPTNSFWLFLHVGKV